MGRQHRGYFLAPALYRDEVTDGVYLDLVNVRRNLGAYERAHFGFLTRKSAASESLARSMSILLNRESTALAKYARSCPDFFTSSRASVSTEVCM